MTMEMPLHVCLGFWGDKAHQVDMISLLGRRSGKGHLSLTQGSLCMFIQMSQVTEVSEFI